MTTPLTRVRGRVRRPKAMAAARRSSAFSGAGVGLALGERGAGVAHAGGAERFDRVGERDLRLRDLVGDAVESARDRDQLGHLLDRIDVGALDGALDDAVLR